MIPFPYSLGTRRLPPCAPDLCWPQAFKELCPGLPSPLPFLMAENGCKGTAFSFTRKSFSNFFFGKIEIFFITLKTSGLKMRPGWAHKNKKRGGACTASFSFAVDAINSWMSSIHDLSQQDDDIADINRAVTIDICQSQRFITQ